MCPDPNDPTKEGVCNPELSQYNADSISLVAAGAYFENVLSAPLSLEYPSSGAKRDVSNTTSSNTTAADFMVDYPITDDMAVDPPSNTTWL